MNKGTKEIVESINDTIDDVTNLYGDTWDSSLVGGDGFNPDYHAVTSEKINDVVVRTNDGCRESSWLCDYLAAVAPANVKALIAALEQAQHDKLVNWEAAASLVEENEELKRSIAELENDEVRQRLANAEHQLYMAELAKYNLRTRRRAQFRKRLAAEKRIAELEIQNAVSDASIIELKAQYETVRSASQLSVKLPATATTFDAAAAIRACMDEFPLAVQDVVEECAVIAENTIFAAGGLVEGSD